MIKKPIVVKLGGSTLGSHDTALEDLVSLQRKGNAVVVVHGGGKTITEWLDRQGVAARFVRGFRVTDAETLRVVTAVLAGLVNKELVAAIQRLGGKAVGLSCADGAIKTSQVKDVELGYVGEMFDSDASLLKALLEKGYLPLVAPVTLLHGSDGPLLANMNGDTAAGILAQSVGADRLIFLTDVEAIRDGSGRPLARLSVAEAQRLISDGAASGGMVPKLESCLKALSSVPEVRVIDGRASHALLLELEGKGTGTTVHR